MPKRCPACKKPVPPDAQACPHCPMSFRDEEKDLSSARSALSLSPSSKAAIFLIFIAALAYGAWQGLTFVMEHANGSDSRVLASPPAAPKENPQENPQEEGGWRLSGRVYDLETLKPVPGCALVFSDAETGARHEASTDSQGRYRVTVPLLKDRGYLVRISREGYAPSYLNPGAENVPEMPSEERRRLSRELADSLESQYAVRPYGTRPLLTNFYIAPLAGQER